MYQHSIANDSTVHECINCGYKTDVLTRIDLHRHTHGPYHNNVGIYILYFCGKIIVIALHNIVKATLFLLFLSRNAVNVLQDLNHTTRTNFMFRHHILAFGRFVVAFVQLCSIHKKRPTSTLLTFIVIKSQIWFVKTAENHFLVQIS